MGCGPSKPDDSKLVQLCRVRKDLIRAAGDHRFALAAAHASYLASLRNVGDALERFVSEELSVASSGGSSPVLTIPSSEGKGERRTKAAVIAEENGSVSDSTGDCEHLRFSQDSHLHLSSDEEEEKEEEEGLREDERYKYNNSFSPSVAFDSVPNPNYNHIHRSGLEEERYKNNSFSPSVAFGSVPNPNYNHIPRSDLEERYKYSSFSPSIAPGSVPNPNYNYMRRSSGVPNVVYQSPYPDTNPNPGVELGYQGYGGSYGHYGGGYGHGYYNERPPSPPRRPPSPPPPPPPPEVSAWDFLDPFGGYEQVYSRYPVGSLGSSPNSSEVREKEGIPDLEEETEQEVVREVKKEIMDGGSSGGKGSSSRNLPPPVLEKDSGEHLSGMGRSSGSPECIASTSSEDDNESKDGLRGELVRKKGVAFEAETSLETEMSGPSIESALQMQGRRNVREAVKEIKDQFVAALRTGEELAAMLEVGKLRYQSRKSLRVISSRMFGSFPVLGSSQPSFKQSRLSATKTKRNAKSTRHDNDNPKSGSMKYGRLSSTLETLYVWENRLYKEVKDEEKLRVMYDKKFKQLKVLDDRGEESHKIDSVRASVRNLMTKIDVSIKSIDAIASRIQKLRDEELQPQIIELIRSWINMWNSVLLCHQKQYLAIVDSKTRNLVAKTAPRRKNNVAKDLEWELQSWSSNFRNWISNQKLYLESLNDWLCKYLDVKPELTPDGMMPFSPSRLGAPDIFIMCNDWYLATVRISDSEDEVVSAMLAFVDNLHKLQEIQDEELHQKLKAEYLAKDLASRVNTMQKESSLLLHTDAPHIKPPVASENEGPLDGRILDVDSLKKRLEDEKAKYDEVLKRVHKAASSSLRTGLIPVFGSLGKFSLEVLKAYEGIRIPAS